MEPEVLFSRHEHSALKVASDLSWRYSMTGTYAFLEDMRNVARMGLWEACTRFDPHKQSLNNHKIRKTLDNSFWSVVLSGEVPFQTPEKADPYATFWKWASMRVYGSVMDYLRKEGLITRLQGKAKGTKTMLYKNRFLSGDSVPEGKNNFEGSDEQISFLDLFPSKDNIDQRQDATDRKELLRDIIRSAHLTDTEMRVVLMYHCSEDSVSMRVVSEELGISKTAVAPILKSALEKIRRSPVLLSYREGKELTRYLLWWLFCIKRGDEQVSPVTAIISVPTAGSPVQWLTDTSRGAAAIAVAPHPSNSGTNVYIGTAGMVTSTFTNLIANGILPSTTSWSLQAPTGTSAILPSDYWFDVETNGDKLLVTYWPI